jgi:carbon-monoxide dehydrogenase medium subunit
MTEITCIHQPDKITQATALLKNNNTCLPLAGGTFLAMHIPGRTRSLVDLSSLDLRYVRRDGAGCRIGAMTTIGDIARSAATGRLAVIAGDIATEPLRHMITVGGNVMQPMRWSDLPVLFCVLNAAFILKGSRKRRLTADRFFSKRPKDILKAGELLVEVEVPNIKTVLFARKKIVRAHDDIPALHIAAGYRILRGRIHDARIAYVSRNALPVRLKSAEQVIEGNRPGTKLFRVAAAAAMAEFGGIADMRFSTEYLQEMVGVYTRRILQECSRMKG